MAKNKIKKKPVKKISKIRKRAVSRPKKKVKEISSEIIFDSTVGETDSLFVDVPAQIAPSIYELPKEPTVLPQEKKKRFWQKFFSFFSDN